MYIDFSSFFNQSLREAAGFYPAKSHEKAFLKISDGLNYHHSVFFLRGERGVGKTHILKRLYRKPEQSLRKVWLSAQNPSVSMIMQSFADLYGIRWDPANPNKLRSRLVEDVKNNQIAVLYIDNITSLDAETVIKLSNILRWRKQSIGKIVFTGNFKLDSALAMFVKRNSIKAMQCKLYPLDEAEVHAYLVQLSRASGYAGRSPFDKSAVHALIKHSQGIPARINRLCDYCLFIARTYNNFVLDAELIDKAADDLHKLNLWPLEDEDSTKNQSSQVEAVQPNQSFSMSDLDITSDSDLLKQAESKEGIISQIKTFLLKPFVLAAIALSLVAGIMFYLLSTPHHMTVELPRIFSSKPDEHDSSRDKVSKETKTSSSDSGFIQNKEKVKSELILAVWNNKLSKIDELLNLGVDVNIKNHFGQTPLMIAAMLGNKRIVETMLKNGADIDSVDNKGLSALMLASRNGQTDIVEHLLNRGADINIQDKRGMTAIMHATSFGHRETVELILKYHPNLELKSNQGQLADAIAQNLGYEAIADIIRNAMNRG